MEIIKTYLENLFAGLPKTKEVLKMKADLLSNMMDKYEELKRNGKTENEAIGIVISEFGNIDELAKELGVDINSSEVENIPTITEEIANAYMDCSKKMGNLIAIGVLLCILSPIVLILLNGDYQNFTLSSSLRNFIGLVVLFMFVAPAVGIFIYAGMKLEKYEYLKNKINTPTSVKQMVQTVKENFENRFVVALIVSIILYIFSPTFIIGAALFGEDKDEYIFLGIAVLLIVVAIATYVIVRFGIIRGSHNLLLRLGDYSYVDKKSEKLINAVAGIYWPIVVVIYFFWSFIYSSWNISWIVFPIGGVLFGALSTFIRAMKKDL